jgi:hypothetical protein
MSRNWMMPASAARHQTARPRNARFSREAVLIAGYAFSALSAVSRSAAKLSLPE